MKKARANGPFLFRLHYPRDKGSGVATSSGNQPDNDTYNK